MKGSVAMTDKNIKFSVIAPVFNGERYLKDCIDSVLNQEYSNLEIILVDDGSTDRSGQIIDGYAAKDKRVLALHQSNKGVSAARNLALSHASGEYVGFIDADDFIAGDYFSYFYKLLSVSDAEIALIPKVNKFTGEAKEKTGHPAHDKVEIWTGQRAACEMLYYNVVISSWGKIFSRKLIEDFHIRFQTSIVSGEGFCFAVACFQRAKKVVVGHKKVYYYRLDNPESAMTKFRMRIVKSSIETQDYMKRTLVEKTPDLLRACRYANWHTHCDCLNSMIGSKSEKKHPKEYKEIKKVCRRHALTALRAPIPKKEKIKGVCYFLSPFLTACIINHFRMRKFTREE